MRVLYVEDNASDADLTRQYLARRVPEYKLEVASTYHEALSRLSARVAVRAPQESIVANIDSPSYARSTFAAVDIRGDDAVAIADSDLGPLHSPYDSPYDLVLTDLSLPDGNGMDLLAHIRTHRLPMAVVVLTGAGSEEIAVGALKAGADDYIIKTSGYRERLPIALSMARERFLAESARIEQHVRVLYVEHNPVDRDLTMQHIKRFAPHIQFSSVQSVEEMLAQFSGYAAGTTIPHTAPPNAEDPLRPLKYDPNAQRSTFDAYLISSIAENTTNQITSNTLDTLPYDVVLVNHYLPQMSGLDALKELVQLVGDTFPVVLLTGQGNEHIAVQALRLGAYDYVVKTAGYLYQLPVILENAFHRARLVQEKSALMESEARFRQLAETIDQIFFLYSPPKHQLLYLSPAYSAKTGMSVSSLYNDPASCFEAIVEEDQPKVRALWHRLFAEHAEVVSEEFRLLHSNGAQLWVAMRLFPIYNEGGEVWRVAGLVEDISARKQAEHYIQQQDRLAAVGQLAAGIAHDFKNIIAVIVLYTQLLQLAKRSPKDSKHLEQIYTQAQNATRLIDQMLDFSRTATLSWTSVEMVTFLRGLSDMWQRTLPENISIELISTEMELAARIDTGRLQQALLNLVLNARDAMPGGGKLRISLTRLDLDKNTHPPVPELSPGAWVQLSIMDTGMGIADELLPHIFDPFFTTKGPGKGSGLGLPQVYGVVRQMDGHVAVRSKQNYGTTVVIYLPLLDQIPELDSQDSDGSLPAGHGETILLVEDEVALQEVTREMLVRLDYNVLVANNGWAALAIMEQHADSIRLVVSDVVMPEMGGIELYQVLSQDYPTVPMIFVTGYAAGREARSLLESDEIIWIQKPYTIDQLARAVHSVLAV